IGGPGWDDAVDLVEDAAVEGHVDGLYVRQELLPRARADARRRDHVLLQHPRDREVDRVEPRAPRERREGLRLLERGRPEPRLVALVHVLEPRPRRRVLVRVHRVFPGQQTAGDRRPGEEAKPVFAQEPHAVGLDAPVEQVVRRFLADRVGPATKLAAPPRLRDAPRGERARPPVADLPGLHARVERLDRFVERSVEIAPMQHVHIDPIRLEPLQLRVELAQQIPSAAASVVRPRAHGVEDLRGEHDLVTNAELAQSAADDRLATARVVVIARVPERDAAIERRAHERERLVVGGRTAEVPRTEAELADRQAAAADTSGSHGANSPPSFALLDARASRRKITLSPTALMRGTGMADGSIEARVRRLEDERDIVRTLYRYAQGLDYGPEQDFVDVFTEDAKWIRDPVRRETRRFEGRNAFAQ